MRLENTDIIIAPFITEKTTDLKDNERVLCFKVHKNANKIQVKYAVEKLFDTKVDSVKIMNYSGKEKRYGKYTGKRSSWKKAYIKLNEKAKMLEYFEVG
jgi:large subunit ribosomal protein L23